MEQNNQNQPANVPPDSAEFGSVQKRSEGFRNVPNISERFGNFPKASDEFGTIPKTPERKENHTHTVREVARMFEAAGVARTERSIINWCQPNRMGMARLDAYFDPNERMYFITLESVNLAIQEEQSKAARAGDRVPPVEPIPNRSEPEARPEAIAEDNEPGELRAMRQEIIDLKITNRGKDYFIEQLQNEREGFAQERQNYVDKLMSFNRKVGELETKLLAVEAPKLSEQFSENGSKQS